MQALDVLVAAAVEEPPRTSPPPSPQVGSCYLVDNGATGAWVNQAGCLAAYTSGGWRFVAPVDGLRAYVKATGTFAVFAAGDWEIGTIQGTRLVLDGNQVVGSRAAAITSPSGGATVDSEARAAIAQILSALRGHGLIQT